MGKVTLYKGGLGGSVVATAESFTGVEIYDDFDSIADYMVVDGGTAFDTSIDLFGTAEIVDGAMDVVQVANEGCLSVKGGSASNVILNYGGSLEVYDGGFASNVILNPYSNVNVYAGGKIGDITVGGFAKLNVASGGIVTGTMNIKDGSSIKFANGAKVEFDLAVPLSEGAYINALSQIIGHENSVYTVIVPTTQNSGRYLLAGSAADFENDLIVKNSAGEYTLSPDLQIITQIANDGLQTCSYGVDDGNVLYFDLTSVGPNFELYGVNTVFSGARIDGIIYGGKIVTIEGDQAFFESTSITLDNMKLSGSSRIYGLGESGNNCYISAGSVTINITGDSSYDETPRIYGGFNAANVDAYGAVLGDTVLNLSADGAFSNVFAGACISKSDCGYNAFDVFTTISNGTYFGRVSNGSQVAAGSYTSQEDSTLNISGGIFKLQVSAGAFSQGGIAQVWGDCNLNISGGTFEDLVFAGCGASSSANGGNTMVDNDTFLNVDVSGDNKVSFLSNVYGGSMGAGSISGNTTMTFTGNGANLVFGANSVISGASQGDTLDGSSVVGNRTLVFDDFHGDFSGSINNGFDVINISGSDVAFTSDLFRVSKIETWDILLGSAEDGVVFSDDVVNQFSGDYLNVSALDGYELSGEQTLFAGFDAASAFRGFADFSTVNLFGEDAAFSSADNAWVSDNYKFFNDGNDLKVATLA